MATWREFKARGAALAVPRNGFWSESFTNDREGRRAARRRARALRRMGHVTRYESKDGGPIGSAYVLNVGRVLPMYHVKVKGVKR